MDGSTSGQPQKKERRISGRAVATIVIAVVAVVFIVENYKSVKIRLIVPEVRMPLFFALAIVFIAGGVTGYLVRRHTSKND